MIKIRIIILSFVASFLLSSATCAQEIKNPDKEKVDIIGMNTHFAQQSGDLDVNMDLLDSAGVSWIRDEYSWSKVEKERGVYTFPEYLDDYINAANEKGIKVLLCMEYGNPLYDGGGAPYTDEGRMAFANYVKAVIEHLGNKISAVEIWNEWSGGFGTGSIVGNSPQLYAELLKVVYPILKEAAPDIAVVAGATHNEGTEWFEKMLESGAYNFFDILSYHPYNYPNDPDIFSWQGSIEQNLLKNNNLMRRYGGEKPIWLTEYGWPSGSYSHAVSEELQAAYLVRMFTMGAAYGIDKIFWYDFQNDGTDISNKEHNFGIIKNKDDENPNVVKPAYEALTSFSSILSGCVYIKEYRPAKDLRCYHFYSEREKKDVAIMYSVKADADINLLGNTSLMSAYDMYGNEIVPGCLSKEPIYLVGENFSADEISSSFRKSVSASLSTASVFDGIRADYNGIINDNGWKIGGDSAVEAISFDIDDSYIFGGVNNIELTLRYIDFGRGDVKLRYDSVSGIDEISAIGLTDSGEEKTVSILIDNARFKNGLSGNDLEIFSEDEAVILSLSAEKVINKELQDIGAVLSDESAVCNLSVWSSPYANREKVFSEGDKSGWISDRENGFSYLICDVEDSILYGGRNSINIEIEYLDRGRGSFQVQYGASETNRFQNAYPKITLTDSGEWKKAVISIADAACINNTNNGDFRIEFSDEDVCIGGVFVKHNGTLEDSEVFVNYNQESGMAEVFGSVKDISDNSKVTIEILKPDKSESELIGFEPENAAGTFVYLNQVNADMTGYFKAAFKIRLDDGRYIVRISLPGEAKPRICFLNYFNSNDAVEIEFTDRNKNPVINMGELDYLQADVSFLSGADSDDICIVLAVYDTDKRLTAVNFSEYIEIVSGVKKMNVGVELDRKKLDSGCRAKLFTINSLNGLYPLINSEEIIFYPYQ